MKKTQLSPTFRMPRMLRMLPLGLLLAAALASAPLLTGASASPAPATAKPRSWIPVTLPPALNAGTGGTGGKEAPDMPPAKETRPKVKETKATPPKAPGKSPHRAAPEPEPASAPPAGRQKAKSPAPKPAPTSASKPTTSKSNVAKTPAAPQITALEREAERIAAALTPTQKAKLLALLNEAGAEQLAAIDGVGRSRGLAIEKARPLGTVEDVRKVKGVGIKTLEGLVDHGKTLTGKRGNATLSPKPADADAPPSATKPRRKQKPGISEKA